MVNILTGLELMDPIVVWAKNFELISQKFPDAARVMKGCVGNYEDGLIADGVLEKLKEIAPALF